MVLETLISNEYIRFFVILVISIVIAVIFHFILRTYVRRLTQKTRSDIDDIILRLIKTPLYLLMIFIGLFFAVKSLSILNLYIPTINKIFYVVFVIIFSLLISRIFIVLIGRWVKVRKGFERMPQLLSRMISIIIYLIAILIILDHFNIEITPLIATLGLGGLAIGLALQNTLSNFFAGVHLISDKPIQVGDYIELEGVNIAGYVEDIGWRSTRIKTLPNNIVIVPNSKLAESIIINNSLPKNEMGFVIQCGVSYGSDLKKVERVTIDVAKKIQKTVPGAVKTFEPFIRFHTFGDSNINFSIILRVEKFVDKYLVQHEFIKALKERYDKENIEISWPVRKIYQRKE